MPKNIRKTNAWKSNVHICIRFEYITFFLSSWHERWFDFFHFYRLEKVSIHIIKGRPQISLTSNGRRLSNCQRYYLRLSTCQRRWRGLVKIPVNVVYEWPLKVFILYLKRQCNRFPISSHWVNSSANRLDVHYIGRPM